MKRQMSGASLRARLAEDVFKSYFENRKDKEARSLKLLVQFQPSSVDLLAYVAYDHNYSLERFIFHTFLTEQDEADVAIKLPIERFNVDDMC